MYEMLKFTSETLIYIRYAWKKVWYIKIFFHHTRRGIKCTKCFEKHPKCTFQELFPLSDKLDIGLPPGHLPDLSIGTGDTSGMPHIPHPVAQHPLHLRKKLHKPSATSPNPDYIDNPPDPHNVETPARPPVSTNSSSSGQ